MKTFGAALPKLSPVMLIFGAAGFDQSTTMSPMTGGPAITGAAMESAAINANSGNHAKRRTRELHNGRFIGTPCSGCIATLWCVVLNATDAAPGALVSGDERHD